jgi:hypothetical protein
LSLAKAISIGFRSGEYGGEIKKPGIGRLDQRTHAVDFVSGQIVHHDDIAIRQARHQNLFDIDEEPLTVHGTVEHARRTDLIAAQTGDKSRGLPMSPRRFAHEPPSPCATASLSNHFGVGSGLVDEDKLAGIKARLLGLPRLPRFSDVGPFLLDRVQLFF